MEKIQISEEQLDDFARYNFPVNVYKIYTKFREAIFDNAKEKGYMKQELKPCPFCGMIPQIEYCKGNLRNIRCQCGARINDKQDIVGSWNNRVGEWI